MSVGRGPLRGRTLRPASYPVNVVIGVISDTHGLLRPEAVAALRGVELILHAGDIGGEPVVEALRALAPVVAVRGNNDRDPWGRTLPEVVVTEAGGARICIVHDLKTLRRDVEAEAIDVVVSGHSHRPVIERRGRALFVNPGSAGPRRFSLPIALALLHLGAPSPRAELVPLSPADAPRSSPRRRARA